MTVVLKILILFNLNFVLLIGAQSIQPCGRTDPRTGEAITTCDICIWSNCDWCMPKTKGKCPV